MWARLQQPIITVLQPIYSLGGDFYAVGNADDQYLKTR